MVSNGIQWYPMVSGAEQLWGHGGAFPILNAVANTAGNVMLLRGAPRGAAVHDACRRSEIDARSERDRREIETPTQPVRSDVYRDTMPRTGACA